MPWLLSLINIISTIIIIIWGLWIWFNFATTGNTEQQNKPIEPSVVLGYDQCELMQCGNWSGAQCSSGSTRYRSTFPISASVQYYVNHLYFFILKSGPIHTSEKENKKISSYLVNIVVQQAGLLNDLISWIICILHYTRLVKAFFVSDSSHY